MYRYELSSLHGHSKLNPWCRGADLARGGGHSMPPPSDKGLIEFIYKDDDDDPKIFPYLWFSLS